MRDQDEPFKSHSTTPLVGRPRGAAWRALQADGVVWEGQVLLVGDQLDLAARMIVTHRRVAFARGGDVVLDVARPWLRPAPYLRRDGSVVLSIATPGGRYGEPPETVALRMREGEPAAGHLVAMLAGSGARRVPADLDALEAVIRPALPERTEERLQGSAAWPEAPVIAGGSALVHREPSPPALPASVPPPFPEPDPALPAFEPVIRQPAPPIATGHDRDWNLPLRQHLVPRGQRRSRWGWALRITGLVALLSTAAGLGAGRIPSPLDALGNGPAPPIAPASSTGPTATAAPLLAQSPAERTAIALGIGGPRGEVEPSAPEAAGGDDAAAVDDRESLAVPAEPTATPPPPAIASNDAATVADEVAAPPAAAQEATAPPTEAAEPAETPTAESTSEPAPLATPEPPPSATPRPTSTATPEPTTAAPDPTAAQAITAATAEPAVATAQAAGEFAVAPRLAVGGPTLPAYGLPPSADGNWLVVVVDVANRGSAPISVPLADFRLRAADGAESPLDPGADLVSSIAGLDPAGAPDDAIELGPDETRRLLLLFQVDPAASGLTLLAGEEEVPLLEALATGGDLADLPEEPSAP